VILEVVTKELKDRQALLTVKVEEEWLDPFLKTASRRLANRVAVPGFRRGKAPHRVVLRHLGKEALIREAMDELGKAAYDEALEESGLEPIQLDDFEIVEWEPLTLGMTVSLKPVVEPGAYQSMPVAIEEVKVEEGDAEDVLRHLQEKYAEKVSVERPAARGDLALVDVEGTLEGRVVLKMDQQEYELAADAEFPIADFGEKLIGMSAGDEKSFSVTFPDDYDDGELAGQEVAFRVHLHNVQEKRLPEMDDELAKIVGGFATLQELREKIREDLYLSREAKQKDELADKLLDSIAEEAQIDYPPLFLNRELETMVRMFAFDLQEQGFTLEGYLRTAGRTAEDFLDELRPAAEERVRKSLVLGKLVEEEGIEVEDSEIEEELARVTQVYGQDTQEIRDTLLRNERIKEDTRNRLCGRKIVERLSAISSRGEEESMEGASVEAEAELSRACTVDEGKAPASTEAHGSSEETLSDD